MVKSHAVLCQRLDVYTLRSCRNIIAREGGRGVGVEENKGIVMTNEGLIAWKLGFVFKLKQRHYE